MVLLKVCRLNIHSSQYIVKLNTLKKSVYKSMHFSIWLEFVAAATHWFFAGLLPSEDPAGLTCLLSVRKLFEFNLFTLTLQEGANLWKGISSYILQCFLCCWPQMTRPPLQVTLYFLWLRVCVCVCERMCEGISRLRRSISEWNILSWLWHWLFSCSLMTSQSLTFISPFHLSVHSVCVCLCVLVTRACGCVVCTCQNAHIGNQYSFTSVEKLNY